ncbi:MAG: DNA-directed RNA polymerase subunit omega [Christensenellales bacterium]|jgi:DNA-directed RNA polymerase subunit omega
MIHAPLNKLMERVDSRYTLVSVVSSRAREIVEHPDKSPDALSKPVTAAMDDLLEGRISYERQDDVK